MALRTPLVIGSDGNPEELPSGDLICASAVFSVVTINTTPYNINDEAVILADPQTFGSNITVNLPTAASRFTVGFTELLIIKNTSTTGNRKVLVVPNGIEEIDGSGSTVSLNKFDSLTIVSDGFNWWIV